MKIVSSIPIAAGLYALLAMTAAHQAHAQRSPWWERQKELASDPQAQPLERAQPAQQAQSQPPQTYLVRPDDADQAKADAARPSYTHVDAGVTRLDIVPVEGVRGHGNGGYVKGSVAISDNLYLFGGYDQVSKSFHSTEEVDDGTGQILKTVVGRRKDTVDLVEIGVGTHTPIAATTDFIGELSAIRFGFKVDVTDFNDPTNSGSGSIHVNAGKLMLGFRGKPSPRMEWWIKGGYAWSNYQLVASDADIDIYMRLRGGIGNIGGQFQITPTWGIVGEAEFYENWHFYRLGARASF